MFGLRGVFDSKEVGALKGVGDSNISLLSNVNAFC